MTSGPNVHGSIEKLLEDMRTRITLLERRLARVGGGSGSGVSDVAAGMLQAYVGGGIPSGWLLCDGSLVSRTLYLELFNAIGTTFGAGDGSTTFNLPDLRGATLVGRDPADADFDTIGETGGEKEHTLTGAELPPVAIETKTHGYTARATTGQYNVSGLAAGSHRVMFNDRNDTSYDGDYRLYTEGGGGPHNNLQPYMVSDWIIATGTGQAFIPTNPSPFTQFQSGLVDTASSVAADAAGNQTVTFPNPFLSAPIVMLTNQENGRCTLNALDITTTSFRLQYNNWSPATMGAGQAIAWQAYTL